MLKWKAEKPLYGTNNALKICRYILRLTFFPQQTLLKLINVDVLVNKLHKKTAKAYTCPFHMQSLQHPYSQHKCTHTCRRLREPIIQKKYIIKSNGQRSQLQDSHNSEEDNAKRKQD